jgi:hypothetical protein
VHFDADTAVAIRRWLIERDRRLPALRHEQSPLLVSRTGAALMTPATSGSFWPGASASPSNCWQLSRCHRDRHAPQSEMRCGQPRAPAPGRQLGQEAGW